MTELVYKKAPLPQWGYNMRRSLFPDSMGGPFGNQLTSLPVTSNSAYNGWPGYSFGRSPIRMLTPGGISTYSNDFGPTRASAKTIKTRIGHAKIIKLKYGKRSRLKNRKKKRRSRGKKSRLRYGKRGTLKPGLKTKLGMVISVAYGRKKKRRSRGKKRSRRRSFGKVINI